MDDDIELEKRFLAILERMTQMDAEIAHLRKALCVLQVYIGSRISPDDPELGVKRLTEAEKHAHDPSDQERQTTADTVAALRALLDQTSGSA